MLFCETCACFKHLGEPDAISNAIGYAKFFSRSHDAVIRVYREAGNVIVTHEQAFLQKAGLKEHFRISISIRVEKEPETLA
jgi:hypothetical protein